MEARAKLLGHPIHQMLIPFPLGLLGMAVVFETIFLVWGNPTMATVSYWMIVAGIVGGLLAAPFGLVDWLAIPSGTRAKSVGALHGIGNLVVLLLFAASWWLRSDAPTRPELAASVLAYAGAATSLLTAWLGGELVDRLSVGVDDGAHLDAPSSLSGEPAGSAAVGSIVNGRDASRIA
jgi:uncharacterized membrane protein